MSDLLPPTGWDPPTKALSLRQPWAWLMVHGHKDIENRKWPTKFRGRVFVHASASMTKLDYALAVPHANANGVTLPAFEDLERGGIVGEFTITGGVSKSESPWFFGPFGFEVINAKPLPLRPCKGMLGFFTPSLPTP